MTFFQLNLISGFKDMDDIIDECIASEEHESGWKNPQPHTPARRDSPATRGNASLLSSARAHTAEPLKEEDEKTKLERLKSMSSRPQEPFPRGFRDPPRSISGFLTHPFV